MYKQLVKGKLWYISYDQKKMVDYKVTKKKERKKMVKEFVNPDVGLTVKQLHIPYLGLEESYHGSGQTRQNEEKG